MEEAVCSVIKQFVRIILTVLVTLASKDSAHHATMLF
jgi:hypothetical protein